ncbi:Uncharacterized protein Adt_11818 [Abeliophyllum distichum]|uniref:Uncharacterized protein n=1 Tax=Abeliophyllum distichum TaxID=126358 RepID=A0ABD1UNZ5_9LAMI
MASKRSVPTTMEKRKKKATGSTSKRSHMESTDSLHCLSKEHKERFTKITSHWSMWRDRRIQLEDFPHSEVFNLIDVCGWSRLAETPHKINSYGQTWVQDKWFMFIPRVMDHYYGFTTEDVHYYSLSMICVK